MIIPNTLLDNFFEEEVRKTLLNNFIYEINDLSDKVFDTAVVHSMIFAYVKEKRNEYEVRVVRKHHETKYAKGRTDC